MRTCYARGSFWGKVSAMKRRIRTYLMGSLALFGIAAGATPAEAGAPVAIYTFTGGADGREPYDYGGLVADSVGNLYGTALAAGAFNDGVVFELKPPASQGGSWTQIVLYSFVGGSDGIEPAAGLRFDAAGNLYGTTDYGGGGTKCTSAGFGCGTVFRLSPPKITGGAWTETVLYRFSGGADGALPISPLVLDASGNLYGTTGGGGNLTACKGGCGVAFKLSPSATGSWTETIPHSFGGVPDGNRPRAGLTLDKAGNLYGATAFGGVRASCCGVIFELSPPTSPSGTWTETVLHEFSGPDGRQVEAAVVFDPAGNLFGATRYGAGNGTICSPYGCGAVFELSPPATPPGPWTEKTLYRFPGGANGGVGFSVLYQGGKLYGTASFGTASDDGVDFVLTPPAPNKTRWTEVADLLSGADGRLPYAALVADPPVSGTGTFYGTTVTGGGSGNGVIYSWTP